MIHFISPCLSYSVLRGNPKMIKEDRWTESKLNFCKEKTNNSMITATHQSSILYLTFEFGESPSWGWCIPQVPWLHVYMGLDSWALNKTKLFIVIFLGKGERCMRLSLCKVSTQDEQHKGQPQHWETSCPMIGTMVNKLVSPFSGNT